LLVLALSLPIACFDPTDADGSGSASADESGTTGATDASATGTTATTASSTSASSTTASSTTDTSATDPSATDPSATDPSATDSSASDPTTDASATDPDTGSREDTTTEGGPGDTEPPVLEFGAFLDASTIRLTFDEPIAAVAGVNPAKFRPSLGWWDSDDCHQVYLDLLNDFPDDNCPCVTVSALQNDPGDEYSILLTLSSPATAQTCSNIDFNYLPVMHYDADTLGTAEHIRDLAGNTLQEMGGQFAEDSGLSSLTIGAGAPYPDFPYPPPILDSNVICP